MIKIADISKVLCFISLTQLINKGRQAPGVHRLSLGSLLEQSTWDLCKQSGTWTDFSPITLIYSYPFWSHQ